MFEPTIDLMFINADSLSKLNDSLSINELNSGLLVSLLADISDTLIFLNDSLDVVQDSIANGGDLASEETSILNAIEEFTLEQTTATANSELLDSLTTIMNDVVTVINTGKVPITVIEFIETGDTLLYLDSAINYTVPLSFDKSFVQYGITIDDFTYEIELDYTISEETDEERNVLIRAKNIQIILPTNSFDSLQACETCTDGTASFILYF